MFSLVGIMFHRIKCVFALIKVTFPVLGTIVLTSKKIRFHWCKYISTTGKDSSCKQRYVFQLLGNTFPLLGNQCANVINYVSANGNIIVFTIDVSCSRNISSTITSAINVSTSWKICFQPWKK